MNGVDLIWIGRGEVCVVAQLNADDSSKDIGDRNGGTIREDGFTNRVLTDLANVRARHTVSQRYEILNLVIRGCVICEKEVEQASARIEARQAKFQLVCEATPDRRVE